MKGPPFFVKVVLCTESRRGWKWRGFLCCRLQAMGWNWLVLGVLQVIKGPAQGEISLGMKLFKFLTFFKSTLCFLSCTTSFLGCTTTAIEQQEPVWAACSPSLQYKTGDNRVQVVACSDVYMYITDFWRHGTLSKHSFSSILTVLLQILENMLLTLKGSTYRLLMSRYVTARSKFFRPSPT